MSATKRGARWELLHSLWIGWTFTLSFFNWVAFLYVGIRVGRKRWLLWGVFYSIPFVLAMALPNLNGWPGDLVVALTFLMGVMGIIHAFLIRKDYLSRLVKKHDYQKINGKPTQKYHSEQGMPQDDTVDTNRDDSEQPYTPDENHKYKTVPEDESVVPSKEDPLLPSEELLKTCVKYLADGYHVGETIPEKKLNNAKSHLPIPDTERVVALIDATAFGSSKLGLAICEGGIYWRNNWATKTNRTFLSWDEFSASEPVGEEEKYKAIKLAEGSLFDVSASSFKKAEAIALLRELQTLANNAAKPDRNPEQPPRPAQEKGEVKQNGEREATATPASRQDEPPAADDDSEAHPIIGRIPQDYPIPLSYSHRLIEAEFESLRILKETYRNAEGLTAFLSSLSLALLDTPTGKTRKQLLNAWRGKGATFGNWYSILSNTTQLLDEDKGPLYSSMKEIFYTNSSSIFAENMSWLIDRRDELHHRDLPVGKETDLLIREARGRLESCIRETAILWERNPLRLVLDYDAIRNSDRVIATCLDYSGDHPAGRKVREEYNGVPKKQDLYILQEGRDWLSLYPFISVHYCSHCSARETHFVDGWTVGDECANLRSFERAHEETSQEIGKALADLLEPKAE